MDQWRTLRDLTAGMRTAAEADDWKEVWRLDEERRACLGQMPQEAPELSLDEAEALKALADDLVSLDRQVMDKAVAARTVAADQMEVLQQGQKAQHAYEENK